MHRHRWVANKASSRVPKGSRTSKVNNQANRVNSPKARANLVSNKPKPKPKPRHKHRHKLRHRPKLKLKLSSRPSSRRLVKPSSDNKRPRKARRPALLRPLVSIRHSRRLHLDPTPRKRHKLNLCKTLVHRSSRVCNHNQAISLSSSLSLNSTPCLRNT